MTTIAWDGVTLAGDRQVTFGRVPRVATKIFRHDGNLIGYAGPIDLCEEMRHWFINGRDPDKFPASQRTKEDYAEFVVFPKSGGILKYEQTPYPIQMDLQHYAIGSGATAAYVAMHLGKTAREAVEIACLFDTSSGCGVDTLSHSELSEGSARSLQELAKKYGPALKNLAER